MPKWHGEWEGDSGRVTRGRVWKAAIRPHPKRNREAVWP